VRALIAVFFVWVICSNPAMAFAVKPTAKSSAALDTYSVLVDDLSDPVNIYRVSFDFYVLENTLPRVGAACVVKFRAFSCGEADEGGISTRVVSWNPAPRPEFKVEVPVTNYRVRHTHIRNDEINIQRLVHRNWGVQYTAQNNLWAVGRDEGNPRLFRLPLCGVHQSNGRATHRVPVKAATAIPERAVIAP
jgi:hypothetical protein